NAESVPGAPRSMGPPPDIAAASAVRFYHPSGLHWSSSRCVCLRLLRSARHGFPKRGRAHRLVRESSSLLERPAAHVSARSGYPARKAPSPTPCPTARGNLAAPCTLPRGLLHLRLKLF